MTVIRENQPGHAVCRISVAFTKSDPLSHRNAVRGCGMEIAKFFLCYTAGSHLRRLAHLRRRFRSLARQERDRHRRRTFVLDTAALPAACGVTAVDRLDPVRLLL